MTNVPPFSFDKAELNRDWMSKDGAEDLARRIKQAWRAAGHKIVVKVEPIDVKVPELKKGHRSIFVVRTNLIGGLPPRSAT